MEKPCAYETKHDSGSIADGASRQIEPVVIPPKCKNGKDGKHWFAVEDGVCYVNWDIGIIQTVFKCFYCGEWSKKETEYFNPQALPFMRLNLRKDCIHINRGIKKAV